MALVTWDARYSVQNAQLDNQHKRLFELVNQGAEAVSGGMSVQATARLLGELTIHILTHFATEERLLQSCGYPDLEAHRQEHAAFVARMRQHQEEIAAGRGEVNLALFRFIKQWLANHILSQDVHYIPHLG